MGEHQTRGDNTHGYGGSSTEIQGTVTEKIGGINSTKDETEKAEDITPAFLVYDKLRERAINSTDEEQLVDLTREISAKKMEVTALTQAENYSRAREILDELTALREKTEALKVKIAAREITKSDVDTLRGITPARKSVQNLLDEEVARTPKFERLLGEEMGAKSAYEMRRNGNDWRNDESKTVPVIEVEERDIPVKITDLRRGNTIERGTFTNHDTGVEIQFGKRSIEEVIAKAIQDQKRNRPVNARIAALYQMKALIENSICFDSQLSEYNAVTSKNKSPNTLFMHSMYGVMRYGNDYYLARLYVEESYSTDKNNIINETSNRVYNVRDMKITPIEANRIISPTVDIKSDTEDTSIDVTVISIPQLYYFVKTYDKNFFENPDAPGRAERETEIKDNNMYLEAADTLSKIDELTLPSDLDKFYVDRENERITQVYYNPDSDRGGQLVYNHFSFDDLFDAVTKADPLDYIAQISRQELVDADSADFPEKAREFLTDNEDFNSKEDDFGEKLTALIEPRYAIYQLKSGDSLRDYRFSSFDELEKSGLYVDRENYNRVYRARMKDGETLEDIFDKFNIARPGDFHGHSLSTSDIIAVKQNGKASAQYVDSAGFKEIPDFFLSREERKVRRALTDNLALIADNQLASDEMDTLGDKLFDYDNAPKYSGSSSSWLIGAGMTADEFESVTTRYHNGEDVRKELAKGMYDNISHIEFFEYPSKDEIYDVGISSIKDENGVTFRTEGGFEVSYSWEQLGDALITAARKEFDRHLTLNKAYSEDAERNGSLYLALAEKRTIHLDKINNDGKFSDYRLEFVEGKGNVIAATDENNDRVEIRSFGMNGRDFVIHPILKEYTVKSIEHEPVFKVEANTQDGLDGEAFLQAYEKTENDTLIPGDILYVGSFEDCNRFAGYLRHGENTREAIKNWYKRALEQREETREKEVPTREQLLETARNNFIEYAASRLSDTDPADLEHNLNALISVIANDNTEHDGLSEGNYSLLYQEFYEDGEYKSEVYSQIHDKLFPQKQIGATNSTEKLAADIEPEQISLFSEPLDKKRLAELDKLTADLQNEFSWWDKTFLDGNSDPRYEDGSSLELIRNHIIYVKAMLLEEFPNNLPEIYNRQTPPEYPLRYQSVKKGDTLRFEYGSYIVEDIEKINLAGEYSVKLRDESGDIITQNLRDIKGKFENLTNRGENPNKALENIPHKEEGDTYDAEKSFAEQVDEVLNGTFETYSSLKVCDTPQVFIDVGCRQLPMLYTQQHLRDALKPKDSKNSHHHGLSVEQIKDIPMLLSKPAILFDSTSPSKSGSNSIVAVLGAVDNDNAPIIVSVVPNGKGQYKLETIDSNFITSIYGKDRSFSKFIDSAIENDKILFWDKQKSQELFKCQGLQLPEALNNLDSDIIIHQSRNIVKGDNEKNTEIGATNSTNETKRQVQEDTKTVDDLRVGDHIRYDGDVWKIAEIDGDFSVKFENADKNSIRSVRAIIGHWKENLVRDGFEFVPAGKIKEALNSEKNEQNKPRQRPQDITRSAADRSSDTNAQAVDKIDVSVPKKEIGATNSTIEPEQQAPVPPDYRMTEETTAQGFGAKTRFAANVAAIETLKKIESESRNATPDEQKILAQYVGWGGIKQAFDPANPQWHNEYVQLKDLLTEEEYRAARASVPNAHYTSATVINAVYKALEGFGIKGGNILEPSCGVGNFFGCRPDNMHGKMYGVELDSITGRIAKQLYPSADIRISGFEKTDYSDNFFDAAIGNVPFGSYSVADKRYDRENFFIHDYFFAKALDKVAPGGIIAFVTSKGTLDKANPKAREYLAKRAELLGAIRLPNDAFKGNANTEVTTDIVFLQKRDEMAVELPDWCYTAENPDGIAVNQYFLDHPEMVLGKMVRSANMYGNENETACIPFEGENLTEQLDKAVSRLQKNVAAVRREEKKQEQRGIIPATDDVRNYTFAEVNGKIYFRENNVMKEVMNGGGKPLQGKKLKRMRGMLSIRRLFREILDAQSQNVSDDVLTELQGKLNSVYDAFVKDFGNISDSVNKSLFGNDDDYNTLCSLEIVDPETKQISKSDFFSKRTIKPVTEVTHADTSMEALWISVDRKGIVDTDYMSELCGKPSDEIISKLESANLIFLDPVTKKYEESAEYLSGNIREKIFIAETAAEEDPVFSRNVEALKAVLPKDLQAGEITARIGVPWVDTYDYMRFLKEYAKARFNTPLVRTFMGEYKIPSKSWDRSVAATQTYGTRRVSSYEIFEHLLNSRDIKVFDTKRDADGNERRIHNKKETDLAQEKARQMKEAFPKWLWSDTERREKYVKLYNELFNSIVGREYDGSHQTFPGMSPFITLNPHQKNAVMRAKLGGNTLLAHCVGAGKSFEMAAATMEKKRLGLINKACVVVPKHLVRQMADEWLRLYPQAKLLVATEKDFTKDNRQKFIGRCCTGDYDAVIMSYQQFEKITMSVEYRKQFLDRELDKINRSLNALDKRDYNTRTSVNDLELQKKRVQAKIEKLLSAKERDTSLNFEQLGFDSLVVDEAHYYKNGLVVSKMRNVAGVTTKAAQKSEDILMKTQWLNENYGEKNIVFATGTPVSNSMTELYIMQQYMRPSLLRSAGLQNFDDWAATFGEVVSQLEMKPAGDGYRTKKRFAKFVNLPELMQMYKEFADIRTAEMLNLPVPEIETGKPQVIAAKPNEYQLAYMKILAERSEAIHNGTVDKHIDNMPKITNEARLLGLDARTLNPDAENYPDSKVNLCAGKVMEIYEQTTDTKGVQIIFCDIAVNEGKKKTETTAADTPDEETKEEPAEIDAETKSAALFECNFSVYKYLKAELIRRGIPEKEICFAGDAKNQQQRSEMYAQLRSGVKRVVIASTAKMGTGANIQTNLCALHNLDIPWKPSDYEQRLGRIVRQGNKNQTVGVYNYVTEGTFDAYMLNLIVTKQKFISQLMSGKAPARSCEDVDETVLNYSEMQAIASGDPRIKEKIELDGEVARLRMLESEHYNQKYRMDDLIVSLKAQISINTKKLETAKADKEYADRHALHEGEFAIKLGGRNFTERKDAGEELRREILAVMKDKQSRDIGEYRGFTVSLTMGGFVATPFLELRAKGLTYSSNTDLLSDLGNIMRLENVVKLGIDKEISNLKSLLNDEERDLKQAETSKDLPFALADELAKKSARLEQLNNELDVGKSEEEALGDDDEQRDPPEIKPNTPKHIR